MTTHGKKTGVLILGCGWACGIHSRILRRMRGVDLFYASRDAGRAEEFRRCFGGRRAFGSYDDGLADDAVDVALVATPTVTHRELALLALSAGKHVIVEKPAFMAAADVDVVRIAAETAALRILVAENYVYKPVARYLREVISAGDLGDVRFVTLNATKRQLANGWRADPALSGGGALFEAGIHWISFASNIGLEVLDAQGHRSGHGDGPDRSSLVVFRYANGAVGALTHSWEVAAPLGGLRLSKVQGTHGAVTFESNGLAIVTTGRRRSLSIPAFADPLGYRAMLADFLRSVRTGVQPMFTADMAKRDLQLMEQAQQSMSSSSTRFMFRADEPTAPQTYAARSACGPPRGAGALQSGG